MTASQQEQDMPMQAYEARYNEIAQFYDFSEELIATVESEFVSDPEAQVQVVEPLVNEVADATDMLTEEFLHIVEAKKRGTQSKVRRGNIETALRRLYVAIDDYRRRVGSDMRKTADGIVNIADPIVEKIQRHVERVVVIFLEFVQLSLDRIMQKTQLDLLRQRETRVAMMMHQLSQQQ